MEMQRERNEWRVKREGRRIFRQAKFFESKVSRGEFTQWSRESEREE